MKLKDVKYKSHWNNLVFWNQLKVMSNLNISCVKMSDFVSFSLFTYTLNIILKNFDFESHEDTLIFFDKKRYNVRFEYVPNKCLILFRYHYLGSLLVIKLRNLDFESHWNTLIFFIQKTMSNSNISWQIVSDWDEASLFELSFGNKLRNTNFKLDWNSFNFN